MYFGEFQLLPVERLLLRSGQAVPLTARAFAVLLALVERAGQLLGKDELMQRVWGDLIVEDNNLAVQVGILRKVLGAEAVATVAGRGYRFSLPVSDAAPVARHNTNLPDSGALLLGREEELQSLGVWLRTQRLVTVVGAGGIGKSRLALAFSSSQVERWRDGVWWVELAGLSDPALLTASVARALGVSMAERETSPAALAAALAGREALLVIDNCEHLLDAVAQLIDVLLQAAPGLRVLATSQEPLHLDAEQQCRLKPLAVPRDAATPDARGYGALALLVARVRAATPGFALSDHDLPLAIELCRRLDGLPLAIELAAARVPLLGLRTVHDRLDERFRLLTAGSRTALRRHQTLRAALAWSHGLLDDGQRRLFMRLGVFSGGFTLALAQALCVDANNDDWAVLEQLAALVAKSLVVLDGGDEPRYRLLESARAFALEELAAAGATPDCLQRHGRAMLRCLKRVDDANMDGDLRTDRYAALVLPELDNLRAAYAWASGPDGHRASAIGLAAHIGSLIDYSLEFVAWMVTQRVHVSAGLADDATAARFWRGLAANNMHGFVPTVEQFEAAQRAVVLYRALGWPKRIFSALRRSASWALLMQDCGQARAALDEAEALLQPDWDPEFRIELLRGRALLARLTGDLDRALTLVDEAIHLGRDVLGDWRLEVIDQTVLADLLWQAGRLAEAADLTAALWQQLRLRPASDYELIDLIETRLWILSERGDMPAAVAAARAGLPVMRRMPRFALVGCAHLLLGLGRPEDAARVLGAQAARARAGLEPSGQVNLARLLAAVQLGLAGALEPARLSALLAAGERLGYAEACALLASAVAQVTPVAPA
jgi:predicted ATPase/DNA-binding winged helix-turn-helix (wHTH) protein